MAPMPCSSFSAGMMMESEARLAADIVRLEVNWRPRTRGSRHGAHAAENASRHTAHHGVRRHIAGDHSAGSYDGALTDAHPVGHHRGRAQPDVVFDDNALGSDALLDKRSLRIVKHMIDGDDL